MIDANIIQKQLEDLLKLQNVPSASVTIYHKGVYSHFHSGFKDIKKNISPDENTLYAIGSCTKSFTAAAIAVLCDQGLVDLDTPVKAYIPEFEMSDPYVTAHLTVRDMLSHRCGLPRHELAWYPRLASYTQDDMIRVLRYLSPSQPFRYKMQYQNQMYALAGFLISRVSNLSWADFVKKYLITPLLNEPAAYDTPDLLAAPNHASGYRFQKASGQNEEVNYATLHTMDAAGSLSLSSYQLAKWDVLLMHNGMYNDQQIISEKMVREMTSPQMLVSDPVAKPLEAYLDMPSYGLGLFVENYRGHKVVQHGGHIDGFIADQCFVPSEDFACTVLTNCEMPFGARSIRYCLLDAALNLEPVNWVQTFADYYESLLQKQTAQKLPASDPNAPCPVSFDNICGDYEDPGYGKIKITCEDTALFLELGTLTLKGTHCRNQYFIFTEDHVLTGAQLKAQLSLDITGTVTGLFIELESACPNPVFFKKL